jgi:hypothetical protein
MMFTHSRSQSRCIRRSTAHPGYIHRLLVVLLMGLFVSGCAAIAKPEAGNKASASGRTVTIRLSEGLDVDGPITGRLYLLVTDKADVEPRLVAPFTGAYYFNSSRFDYPALFAEDVDALQPGSAVTFDLDTVGYPPETLADIPPGEYRMQAVLSVYTQVTPDHGKTIWLPLDQWEGRQFNQTPGNPVSGVVAVTAAEGTGFHAELTLDSVIPSVELPQDTKYRKHHRFKSTLISDFWNRDMWAGVNVTLPKGYDEHPNVRYPVVFHMGHFFETSPLHVVEPKEGEEAAADSAWAQWMAEDTPRFIAVTLMHPTPFYDDSYLVNSDNAGPWQDVLMQEFLPFLAEHYRVIDAGWARTLTGGSTGGWIAAYTQISQPDDFGGAWSYCPDWIDFREVMHSNMYEDRSIFHPKDVNTWIQPEAPMSRSVKGEVRMTTRQFSRWLAVLGDNALSGEFTDGYSAFFGPVGPDGYPVRAWDYQTGEINNAVWAEWRDRGFDLRYYLEQNWAEIGPKLVGDLHFLVGDMDEFYLNLPVYRMQEFLESTTNPPYGGSFRYGRPMVGHSFSNMGTDPWPAAMLKEMAEHIRANAPAGTDTAEWNYP